MRKFLSAVISGVFSSLIGFAAVAGEADVTKVAVSDEGDDRFRFDVSVRHSDEGWDHYADIWEVVGSDGTVYGQRILAHPHVNEQPFTRSQSGVKIPADVKEVMIRAGDKVHGLGGKEMRVKLPGR